MTHWHISCSTRFNNCGRTSSRPGLRHRPERKRYVLCSSNVAGLFAEFLSQLKLGAIHRRCCAHSSQFPGLSGVSDHSPCPPVFAQRQDWRNRCRVDRKLGYFQRRGLPCRAGGVCTGQRALLAYRRWRQVDEAGSPRTCRLTIWGYCSSECDPAWPGSSFCMPRAPDFEMIARKVKALPP